MISFLQKHPQIFLLVKTSANRTNSFCVDPRFVHASFVTIKCSGNIKNTILKPLRVSFCRNLHQQSSNLWCFAVDKCDHSFSLSPAVVLCLWAAGLAHRKFTAERKILLSCAAFHGHFNNRFFAFVCVCCKFWSLLCCQVLDICLFISAEMEAEEGTVIHLQNSRLFLSISHMLYGEGTTTSFFQPAGCALNKLLFL